MLKFCFGLLLSLLTISAFAASTDSTTEPTDPQKTIFVSAHNPTFTLRLPANPTTGYNWVLQSYNPQLLQVIAYKYQAPTNGLIGAGGMSLWTFKVSPLALVGPQLFSVRLIYVRPWEMGDSAKQVQFNIISQPE